MNYLSLCQKYTNSTDSFNIGCRQALFPFAYKNLNGIYLFFKVIIY